MPPEFGSSSQSSSGSGSSLATSNQGIGTINPAFLPLAQLFGIGTSVGEQGIGLGPGDAPIDGPPPTFVDPFQGLDAGGQARLLGEQGFTAGPNLASLGGLGGRGARTGAPGAPGAPGSGGPFGGGPSGFFAPGGGEFLSLDDAVARSTSDLRSTFDTEQSARTRRTSLPTTPSEDAFFGPDILQSIRDLAGGLDPSLNFDRAGFQGAGETALSTVRDLAETGGIGAARDQARQDFQDFTSSTLESLGVNLGLTGRDADSKAILAREAQRSTTALANTAQDRKLLASQLIPGLTSNLLGNETSALATDQALSPGGQALNLLLSLLGVNTGAQSVASSRATSESTNQGSGSSFNFGIPLSIG